MRCHGRTMADPDPELTRYLAQVRAHDEQAARSLVERLYPVVTPIVRAHLSRGEDEQDLMQDVYLKVFDRLDQFRGQVPFTHWVARVAVNTCIDRLRARQRRPSVCWSDLSAEQQRLLDNLSANDDHAGREPLAWAVLEKLLDQLPAAERTLILWLDLEQRSIADVCSQTGWNSGVVRIRAFRARRKLRALFQTLESTHKSHE